MRDGQTVRTKNIPDSYTLEPFESSDTELIVREI